MTNMDNRDYAGMEQQEDGNHALRVFSHGGDPRMTAIEANQALIIAKLEAIHIKLNAGIKVQVVTVL